MNLCMAATYDPDPRAPLGFRVPFNLESGEVIARRWYKWREHDPINLVARYRSNLRSLSRHLHRLRLARPVPDSLRHAHPVASVSPRPASGTPTRNSTTTTPTSTTGWTRACRFSTGRCGPEVAGGDARQNEERAPVRRSWRSPHCRLPRSAACARGLRAVPDPAIHVGKRQRMLSRAVLAITDRAGFVSLVYPPIRHARCWPS